MASRVRAPAIRPSVVPEAGSTPATTTMPKFTSLLPEAGLPETSSAAADHFILPEVGEVWHLRSVGECVSCKELTHWIEPSAHSRMCSTECSGKFWEMFSRAYNAVKEDETVSTIDDPGF